MLDLDRTPPNSQEAEQATLGVMMRSREAIGEVMPLVNVLDFYVPHHQTIFEALADLWERNEPIDIVTLRASLISSGKFEEVGGQAYLIECFDSAPTTAAARYYALIVREKARMRGFLSLSASIARGVYEPEATADALADAAEIRLMALSGTDVGREPVKIGGVVQEIVRRLMAGEAPHPGVKTGYRRLDSETGGFHAGELIMLGARPAVGKSTLSANIAEHAVMVGHVPTVIFSLEMTIDEIALRLIASRARVPLWSIRSGRLASQYRGSVESAEKELREAGLFVDETSMLRMQDIRSKVRRLKARHGLGLVVVDYIQLVSGLRDKNSSRQEEIAGISRGLKQLARECGVPVLAVAQLNRKASEGEEPEMHHLKESGALEQDADVVLLLNRKIKPDQKNPDSHRAATLLLAKQRNGRSGISIKLHFHDDFVRFEDVAEDAPQTQQTTDYFQYGQDQGDERQPF